MIYTLHELQHAASAPLRFWAETSQQLFTNPFSPLAYFPHSSRVAAGSELLARVVRRYEKPEFGLGHTVIDGKTVAVREEVVESKPFCNLLRFRREASLNHPKVLVVAPLSGHYATLLRDTVRALLPDHDVYITDWIDARQVPLTPPPLPMIAAAACCRRPMRPSSRKAIAPASIASPPAPGWRSRLSTTTSRTRPTCSAK